MALGSTQPLTEMSTRRISWGKCGQGVRLTTLPPSSAVVMKSGNLNFLELSGPLQACNGTDLPLPFSTLVTVRGISLKVNRWVKGRRDYTGAMSGLTEGMSNFNTAGILCLKVALSSCGM